MDDDWSALLEDPKPKPKPPPVANPATAPNITGPVHSGSASSLDAARPLLKSSSVRIASGERGDGKKGASADAQSPSQPSTAAGSDGSPEPAEAEKPRAKAPKKGGMLVSRLDVNKVSARSGWPLANKPAGEEAEARL